MFKKLFWNKVSEIENKFVLEGLKKIKAINPAEHDEMFYFLEFRKLFELLAYDLELTKEEIEDLAQSNDAKFSKLISNIELRKRLKTNEIIKNILFIFENALLVEPVRKYALSNLSLNRIVSTKKKSKFEALKTDGRIANQYVSPNCQLTDFEANFVNKLQEELDGEPRNVTQAIANNILMQNLISRRKENLICIGLLSRDGLPENKENLTKVLRELFTPRTV